MHLENFVEKTISFEATMLNFTHLGVFKGEQQSMSGFIS
jgi:hypothetical protein